METILVGIELQSSTCIVCGCIFGMTPHFIRGRRENGGTFYCPNGHQLTFGESEMDQLRKRIAEKEKVIVQKNQRIDQIVEGKREVERSLIATKGVVTRLKNRAGKGQCPCCDTVFENLQSHMKEVHPEYEQSPD